jgi:hypothetical protein
METIAIGNTGITTASRIALGTWAIGGWMWGGTLAVMLMVLATVCIAVSAGVGIARLHADRAAWDKAASACGGSVATEDETENEETIALVLEHRRAMLGYR